MLRATRRAMMPLPTCSITLRCFTTGVVATPRSHTWRRFSSCETGSAIKPSKYWRHNPAGLEDEKQGEAHYQIEPVIDALKRVA